MLFRNLVAMSIDALEGLSNTAREVAPWHVLDQLRNLPSPAKPRNNISSCRSLSSFFSSSLGTGLQRPQQNSSLR
jgi:hypothetical protein